MEITVGKDILENIERNAAQVLGKVGKVTMDELLKLFADLVKIN
jgi:hypothetical protein